MFTGIVEATCPVREVGRHGAGMRIRVSAPHAGWTVRMGDSVCVSGACLTVAALCDPRSAADGEPSVFPADMLFDLTAETLARTWFGELEPGRQVHLERSLRLGDRLDGHLVTGHVDGRGRIVECSEARDGGSVLTFELEERLERYLIDKGSIAIDGVSLTVVEPRARRFRVALIPATLRLTSFGAARVGQRVNVEADMVGKWIEKLLPR